MALMFDRVVSVISKPPAQRSDTEILSILPWLKKKYNVFNKLKTEIVEDLIHNCYYEKKMRDDFVIRQGDKGDTFYVLLRGKIGIYINHQKHEDENDTSALPEIKPPELDENGEKKELDRTLYGNFIVNLGSGASFGEVALISEDCVRTASIIADEPTDLLVISKPLYDRCVHAVQAKELQEKENFINNSPFFGPWAKKYKKLLSLCLEREQIPYDTVLAKQGEQTSKIYFLISGQTRVVVDPTTHPQQYPKLYPLELPEHEEDYVITWAKGRNSLKARQNAEAQKERRYSAIIQRRRESFTETVQRLKSKNLELGYLGPGAIIGMLESVLDLPTNTATVTAIDNCDIYYLLKRNYDRLVVKRNPKSIDKMKENVEATLRLRISMPPADQVALLRSLQYKLQKQLEPQRKQQIDNMFNWDQIVEALLPGRASLMTQGHGPMFFRNKLREKLRKAERKFKGKGSSGVDGDGFDPSAFDEMLPLESSDHEGADDAAVGRDDGDDHQRHHGDDALVEDSLMVTLRRVKQAKDYFEYESSDSYLGELEDKIKSWHRAIQQDAKAAVLSPRLKRFDKQKVHGRIKNGGKFYVRRRMMVGDPAAMTVSAPGAVGGDQDRAEKKEVKLPPLGKEGESPGVHSGDEEEMVEVFDDEKPAPSGPHHKERGRPKPTRQYTKEEYYALKEELKKMQRRSYSMID